MDRFESIVVYAHRGRHGWDAMAMEDGAEWRALGVAMLLLESGKEEHVAVLRHCYAVSQDGGVTMRVEPLAEWTRADVELVAMVQDVLRIWADYDCANEEVPHAAE